MAGTGEIQALLKLNAALPFGADRAHMLVRKCGSAGKVLELSAADLFTEFGFTLDAAEKTVRIMREFDADAEMGLAVKNGIRIIASGDPDYPRQLAAIYDPPLVLYVKGCSADFSMPAVSIVGTRHPSPYGLRMTAEIASGLAEKGIAVTSGLARGIDSAAHKAVTEAGGVTWAALGTGLMKIYPPENRSLSEKIIECGGALVSEYPLMQTARPASFPRRNRIISGLSYGVLVIEGTFKSGSLITARCALEQGREVMALPGLADNEKAQGPNYLIKNGACLVENTEDIMTCLPADAVKKKISENSRRTAKKRVALSLSPEANDIYDAIQKEENGLTPDELALRTGQSVPAVSAALFELEVEGFVFQIAGRYVIKQRI